MLARRPFLITLAALGAARAGAPRAATDGVVQLPDRLTADPLPPAFAARGIAAALEALGLPPELPADAALALEALDLVEDGAVVEVGLRCDGPGVRRLWLLVDRNPSALVVDATLAPALAGALRWRIRLAETGDLMLVARQANGQLVAVRRRVAVTIPGCGDTLPPMAAPDPNRPPGPTRLRARAASGPEPASAAELRLLIQHEQASGQQRDLQGQRILPWHLTRLALRGPRGALLDARLGSSVSRNPSLAVRVEGLHIGERLGVDWVDNRGFRQQASAEVEASLAR